MRWIALLCALLVACPVRSSAAQQSLGIDPAHTYALVVGVLEWKNGEDWSSFETTYRRDEMLVEHLKKRGITGQHLIYLKDKAATLAAIRASLELVISRAAAGDTLLVYYCGHGFLEAGEGYFANYDITDTQKTYWSMTEIVDTIQAKFPGTRAILLADCCHSGRLAENVQKRTSTRISYGVFCSSSAAESSTGNWTFTQAVYDALTGSPLVDRNHDGTITCAELSAYAADEMTVLEGQRSQSCMVGGFSPDTVLSTATTTKLPPHYGERVKVLENKKWWNGRIIDTKGDQALVRWVAIGYDTAESDEWHPLARCVPLKMIQYAVGERVEVKWKKKWYPSTVLKVEGIQHFVHYEGWDSDSDQWVGLGRIRPIRNKRK